MTHKIVFGADGCVLFPDLPDEITVAAEALEAPIPRPAAAMRERQKPRWWRARQSKVPLTRPELEQVATSTLWALHASASGSDPAPGNPGERQENTATLLGLKSELARRSLMACDLCALRCGADRWSGERGACGSSRNAHYTRCFLNWSEERHLTPGISVFLSGCNWECVYCQYPENLDTQAGPVLEPSKLASRIESLWQQGGANVHWVGGNPDQHLWAVLETLAACRQRVSVVWNSNGYASKMTLRLLNGIVDTHIVDFRHWPASCAERYGVPSDSQEVIKRNLKLIASQDCELIVRHLQLPGHFSCCTTPILRWLAKEIPQASLNLMHGQYRPAFQAHRYPEINRRLTAEECGQAERLARSLNLSLVE